MTVMNRRTLLAGSVAAGAVAFASTTAAAKPKPVPLTMHRSPTCGCCHKWAEIAGRSGFTVTIANSDDIMAVKSRFGVPRSLLSCHTSQVGGYIVEGHVPIEAMHKLLRARPAGIVGIGVAGMPIGSPGMESPDGRKDPIIVKAWDAKGNVRSFA